MSDAVQLQVVPLRDNSCSKPLRRLEQWSLRLSSFPQDHGAIVLTGLMFGHPEFADGTEIVTCPLWLIVRTDTADVAYTNAAVYELAAAQPNLIAALLEPE